MQHLTHTPTENPGKTTPGNQPNIYDINIQRQELNKVMLVANTIKGKLDSQQKTNSSWIVTKIKAILKMPIQKFENPVFLFRKAHEAAVRNKKILAAFNGDLGAAIAAQKYIPVNYGSEFQDTEALKKLFFHHEGRAKIIDIIQQESRYRLDPIEEETQK